MTDYDNYKSINLEDYINCVVKVLRRGGIPYYGKIKFRQDDTHPFVFNLGNGGGLCYTKSGNCLSNNKPCEYDIIGIQKIAQQDTSQTGTE